ncbi:MAG: hypothetical protein QOG87_1348 [Actinomycetota bacterium]|jgi:UDP-N-acetylmuramyl pentapeptide phosphotransferase/UDP-N-acetylglucosamine-1-phosphate transferase
MEGSALLAFGVTTALAPLTLIALRRYGVIDTPNPRSSHSQPVPRGLGFALAVGALVALATSNRLEGFPALGLAIPTAAYGVLGLIEDLRGVAAIPRLIIQVAIAVCALPFLLQDMTGPAAWMVIFAIGTVIWLVGFVNSFNFMDGINGISVAQTLVAGAAFVIIGQTREFDVLSAAGAIAVAVALGFAPMNYPRALGFLGDVGSYFIGAWLAVLVVIGLRAGVPFEAMLGSLAIYLADTATTLIRRLRMHEKWWAPHRSHVYQRLTEMGWSHEVTTAFVTAMMLLCGLLGTLSMVGSLPVRGVADIALALTLVFYVTTPRRITLRRERRTAPLAA